MPTQQNEAIPSVEDFLLRVPLYEFFAITEQNWTNVKRVEGSWGPIDTYCVNCQRESVFKIPGTRWVSIDAGTGSGSSQSEHERMREAMKDRIFAKDFECTRDSTHHIIFYFRVFNKTITKIGQFPSLADIHTVGTVKYRAILGNEKYRELTRAVGLASHGVGIGSFVYLRRIFEHLIEEAHQKAVNDSDWDEERYTKGRLGMDEKIVLLKSYLPDFLIENKSMYSILSVGVHSLSEQECLRHFEPVKLGIELILDERIEAEERRKKLEQATRAISAIRGQL